MNKWGQANRNDHSRIVMRDLARNMVSYMGFRDAMRRGRANPTHKRAEVAEQITIKR